MKIAKSIRRRLQSGYYRRKYGLETDSHSMYFDLRQKGYSDEEAQFIVFKNKGVIK